MPHYWRIRLIGIFISTFGFLYITDAQTADQKSYVQIQHYGIDAGLSSVIVHCFFQDSRGFMWVGTDYGLNRFDGLNFKAYTQKQDGLSKNQVAKIFELDDKKLWLCSSNYGIHQVGNTVDIFDPIEEKNTPLLNWVENPDILADEQVYDMFLGINDEVFLPTISGKIYIYKSKRLRLYATLPQSIKISNLQADSSGIWVDSRQQLLHFTPNEKWQVAFSIQSDKRIDILPNSNSDYILYEIGDIDWKNSSNTREIRKYYKNGVNQLLISIPPSFNPISIDIENEEVGVVRKDTKEFGILSNGIFKSLELPLFSSISGWDKQGGLWVSNPPEGIARIQLSTAIFRNYLKNRLNSTFKTTSTRGITIDDQGDLYIVSQQELHQFHTDSLKNVPFSEYLLKVLDKEGMFLSLLSTKDTMWVGHSGGYLLSKPSNGSPLTKHTYTPLADSALNFDFKYLWHWSLLKDRKSRIWIGHEHGLSYLNRENGNLYFYNKLNGFDQLRQSLVNQLYENDQGIWIVSSAGLYLLDPSKGIQSHFYAEAKGDNYLPHNQLHHLYEDENGFFWLASGGGGLIKWHPKTKETEQFAIEDGLSHNVIYAIYEDDYNNLWLSSNRGIMRFDKKSHFVTTYLTPDGITHEEFNRISHYQADDGTIYFGGLNGVTSFHPKDFQTFPTDSSDTFLQFTQFKIQDGNSGIWKDLTSQLIQTQKVVLQPNDLGFSLEFAHLDFSNHKKNQFAYLIEGIDHSWNHQQANFIRINNLPYGNFKLRIKVQKHNGIWSNEKVIDIQVVKPIYLRYWFFILATITFAILIILLIKWQLYRSEKHRAELQREVKRRTIKIEEDKEVILQQTQELTKLDKLKSRFFANISHELRTPLTLILGPAKHAQSTSLPPPIQETLRTIEANGESLLQLVEEILELTKLEANQIQINERPIDLTSLLEHLYSNFEPQAIYQEVQYELDNWTEKQPVLLDSNKFTKIINNLIANALKFTPKGKKIHISAILTANKEIEISVTDTGKGIHSHDIPYIFERFYQSKQVIGIEQGGAGIGLALSKELAELMKGRLEVSSKLGIGSTFKLSLPFKSVEATAIKAQDIAANLPTIHQLPTSRTDSLTQQTNPNNNLEHLLLVEDNPSMQHFIVSILQKDYHISTANHGREALAILEIGEQKIDLIISDVMMPEMDGFTLLEKVKSSKRWRGIPIIMLTARAAEADRLKALRIGVDDYLTKPFSTQELQARIQNLLTNYQERLLWNQTVTSVKQTSQTPLSVEIAPEELYAEVDQEWLKKLEKTIMDNIGHNHLNVDDIACNMNLSRRQLSRKIKQLTGLSPLKYQRELQLNQARQLLEKGSYATVSEVVHRTGFKTHHHFTQLYVTRFGKKPSEYFK